MDPFRGDVFVYCSKRRDRIRYIYWNNDGFNVVSRRKENGGYPWPQQKFGAVISVTGKDLELILQSGKSPSTSSTANWNNLVLPCGN
jgi:transposase